MSIVHRTKTYAVCPTCGADAGCVDHLLWQHTTTLWYCDTCGHRYRLAFSASGDVDVTEAHGRSIPTIDVLVLPPQSTPVYFVVEGIRLEDGEPEDAATIRDHKWYHYEEHSCPTNWLEPLMVYADGDTDPHGLLKFVSTVDASTLPPAENYGPSPQDAAFVELIEQAEKVKP